MNTDLKKESGGPKPVCEEKKSLKMGFLLRFDICQKSTRGDSVQVKVELLLQLSPVLVLRWKEMVGISKHYACMTGHKICLVQDNIIQRPFHTCTISSFFPIPPLIRTILQLIPKHSS